MKTQQNVIKSGNMQGRSTSDRAFDKQREDEKQQGISNSGGQLSNQTSNKDSRHKPEHKK